MELPDIPKLLVATQRVEVPVDNNTCPLLPETLVESSSPPISLVILEVRLLIVVVARVEVPVTFNVPFDVKDEVAVMFPPVSVLNVAVIALSIVENRFDEVAFVRFADVA